MWRAIGWWQPKSELGLGLGLAGRPSRKPGMSLLSPFLPGWLFLVRAPGVLTTRQDNVGSGGLLARGLERCRSAPCRNRQLLPIHGRTLAADRLLSAHDQPPLCPPHYDNLRRRSTPSSGTRARCRTAACSQPAHLAHSTRTCCCSVHTARCGRGQGLKSSPLFGNTRREVTEHNKGKYSK